MDPPPLLSLCMIVKNGGALLERALRSAAALVDEIVVVDTGSTDRSREVARSLGARVLEHPWSDDFAAARNVGLDAARGRWILILDADEELVLAPGADLRAVLHDHRYLGYYVPVTSSLGKDRLEVSILRIFRAHPRVRFRYPIHEQVLEDLMEWSEESGMRFGVLTDVSLRHDGYLPEELERHGKRERNLRLFDKALREYPDNLYLWYKYADALRSLPDRAREKHRAAERAAEIAAGLGPAQRRAAPYLGEVFALLVASRLEEGRLEEAGQVLEREPPQAHGSPNYDYVAAVALHAAGRFDPARELLDRCIEGRRHSAFIVQRPAVRNVLARGLRAKIHLLRGDLGAAEADVRALLAHDPGAASGLALEADLHVARGEPGRALQVLARAMRLHPEDTDVALQGAALLLRVGQREAADRLLRSLEPRRREAWVARAALEGRGSDGALDPAEREDLELLARILAGRPVGPLPRRRNLVLWGPAFAAVGRAS